MTVSELIEKLKNMPPDALVITHTSLASQVKEVNLLDYRQMILVNLDVENTIKLY